MENLKVYSEHAIRFVEGLENRKDYYSRDGVTSSERLGVIEDYSKRQEQKDIDRYHFYMNSSEYDMDRRSLESNLKEEGKSMQKILKIFRKRRMQHND